jgi:uncharacterized protein YbjT (DUF2867 family)
MKIAIIGASGFVGSNLTKYLLTNTNHRVVALCPNPEAMAEYAQFGDRFAVQKSDVFDSNSVALSLSGVDVAYYLVHMMSGRSANFYDAEARAATAFGEAAKQAEVPRVIYMGGLGMDNDNLSKHLASRHNTGDILRGLVPLVIEFRASMIIGHGSISFEIVKNLVRKLPIMTLPKWSKTLTQPIGLSDALLYLTAGIGVPVTKHEIVEIGGPEKMSYQRFLSKYAEFLNKKCILIRVPVLPEWLAGWWLVLFTPRGTAKVGRHMVASFRNEMIVTNSRAEELFPQIKPSPIMNFFV